ncbi:MAG TPA: UvrD-helicase domain-containing protein [Polyangiaceae bacterium]|nr:UvrD-helicase domain-containing protein [Polyangiaceae bacterium]
MTLVDQRERDRIACELDTTLVVEAAAGTGKTTALVNRVVSIIRSGRTTLDRIVAVTFTEKAAGEMKLRLRSEIDKARHASTDARERQNLSAALQALEIAHINTIHGFCADLLRERPISAGLDPAFEVLDEAGADALLREAFRVWFEHALSQPGPALRRVLRRRNWRREQTTPREDLIKACRAMIENRDFDMPWSTPVFDRERALDCVIDELRALGTLHALALRPNDPLAQALRHFDTWAENLDARERIAPRDHDALEAELASFEREHERDFQRTGSGPLYGQSLDRASVVAAREAARATLTNFVGLAEADLAARLREELRPVVEAYETLKQRAGVLDFVDLLSLARDMVVRDRSVREELQLRFTHLFVDEFQDTDPLQAEILLLLASDDPAVQGYRDVRVARGKLFVVGDPKQSIYRFRRADVVLYQRIKAALLAQGAALLHLTTNFRSVPSIQAAVNAAFSRCMTASDDGSQADYVPLSPWRSELGGQPGVVALPVPAPYGPSGRLTKKAVNASCPDAVAGFVEWLVGESGWKVHEGDALVPVRPRHVCLLFKRFQSYDGDTTRAYVRALEARRIPHMLVGGRSFHDREEVVAIRTALDAIEWPSDEFAVYATLRGPLLAITDEDLLRFRAELHHLNPLRRVDVTEDAKHPEVVAALQLLRSLHHARNRRPIADTIEQLLSETRAHASLAMWPSGEQALANAIAVLDLARSADVRGTCSFRAFIETLSEQADRREGGEAPIVEEGTEGVRLMTVHKAKGLEFPVVVLCDPTAPSKVEKAYRLVDSERRLWAQKLCGCSPLELVHNEGTATAHDNAELVRQAYVAATRAQDLLVVPTFGDASERSVAIGWTDILAPGLYPPSPSRREPSIASGCPAFGFDSVAERSASAQAMPEDSVAPGLHVTEAGNRVVWWDPCALKLHVVAKEGVRQQKLLAPSPDANQSVEAHARWRARREQTVAEGSRPSVSARSITALSRDASGAAAVVESTDVARQGRPRGARFGTLVHAVLAQVPLDAERSGIVAACAALSRLTGASSEEAASAVDAVVAALAHPRLCQARSSKDVRREVAISRVLDDGTLVEGIIDLAYRTQTGWVVVDFKTDQNVETAGVYAEQLRQYVDAVQRATGESASGVLLRV